jgi:hypothetical protein
MNFLSSRERTFHINYYFIIKIYNFYESLSLSRSHSASNTSQIQCDFNQFPLKKEILFLRQQEERVSEREKDGKLQALCDIKSFFISAFHHTAYTYFIEAIRKHKSPTKAMYADFPRIRKYFICDI